MTGYVMRVLDSSSRRMPKRKDALRNLAGLLYKLGLKNTGLNGYGIYHVDINVGVRDWTFDRLFRSNKAGNDTE